MVKKEKFYSYKFLQFHFCKKSFGFVYVVVGSYLLYERDRLLAETGFEGVNETTRNLGIAFILLGIPTVVFTLFGIVATLRENLVVLKIVCLFFLNKLFVILKKQKHNFIVLGVFMHCFDTWCDNRCHIFDIFWKDKRIYS